MSKHIGTNATQHKHDLADKRGRQQKRNRVVALLGCMVVLVTALALMVPAISLSEDATDEVGIVMDKQSQASSEAAEPAAEKAEKAEKAEEPAAAEKEPAADEATSDDASANDDADADDSAADDKAKAGDEGDSDDAADADANAAADADDADDASADDNTADDNTATDDPASSKDAASKAEAEDASASSVGSIDPDSKDAEKPAQSFKADLKDSKNRVVLTVEVEAPEGAFPAGTFMEIDGIAASKVKDKVEEAIKDANGKDAKVKNLTAVDIVFKDVDGKEIEPAKKVEVKITSDEVREYDNPALVHVLDKSKDSSKGKTDDAEVINKVKIVGADDTMKFESKAFSPYVIVEFETITAGVITADGEAYKVDVNYGVDAGIPQDAELAVSEIAPYSRAWYNYVDQVNAELGLDEDNGVSYARLFDITILDANGNEIQPAAPVEVKIALDDADELSDDVKVAHFADSSNDVQLIDANLSGKTVTFDAESFSVYAVVEGSTGDEARMTVKFWNGTTLVKEMYVKNADDDEDELAKIIFDPGTGTIQEGWHFLGWTEDQNYTKDSERKTIEDIRTEIKGITAANSITDGDVKNYYAAIYKIVDVTYLGDEGVSLGTDAFLRTPNDPDSFTYTVNMTYSPDATHDFEGWLVDEGGNNIAGWTEGTVYPNETEITISGSVTFSVNAPEGQWLVFHENKGTYIAPQFVKSGETTQEPTIEMKRNGYHFDGWFADSGCTVPFQFGGEINDRTHVYAGWTMNTTAPYMVICWTQNTNRTGYEVADSWVNENGQVGQYIQYNSVDNGDEDYATGVGEASSGTKVYDNGHYLGFCLTEGSKNQQVTITPEGDAVLNLYFDRIVYDFKFYLYRSGTQNNRYDYANNSGNGSSLNDLVTWHSNQTQHPSANGYTIQSETVGGRTYYYFTIQAYYGQDISSIWPTYDKITGANGREAVSYVMMVGTKLKPNATNQGSGTVKGIITVMNENILGATNDADGNYVVVRFPDSYYNWRYHIWFETVEGEDYTGKTLHTHNGRTYYEETVLTVRSSNTTDVNQNEPKYTGFDYQTRLGQNSGGTVWQGGHWTTNQGGTMLYHLNYIYNRQMFKISYFDGNYVGDTSSGETTIQNRAGHLLHESPEIAFGAHIADEYIEYVPEETPEGYVFEGWYLDEGCTVKYQWDTMPLDGIIVYAKWHKKQYRAFLHPEADNDTTLDWGSDDQALNFRVDYLDSISLPFGTRNGYEFVGWFTSSGAPYNEDTKLTDANTVPYDKTVDMTDPMDKWGNGATWNSDAQDAAGNPRNRFWIERKIDLYAKWRKVVDGANGIGIVYDLNGGTGNVSDDRLYKDTAYAVAQNAPAAPANKRFDHWVVQTWNNDTQQYEDTEVVVFPGDDFEVLKSLSKVEVTEWKSTKDNTAVKLAQDPAAVYSGADDNITGPEGYPYISTATYTIQLKAVYLDAGNETPTHIDWYPNHNDDGNDNKAVHHDPDLQINEATDIYPALSRDGYRFLGWARVSIDDSHSHLAPGEDMPQADVLELTKNDVYLEYHEASGDTPAHFTLKDSSSAYDGTTVKYVAADEETPYHDMYAVWEKVYTVKVIKVVESPIEDDVAKSFTFAAGGDKVSGSFTLTGEAEDDKNVKEYKELFPEGSMFSVTETVPDGFDVSLKAKMTIGEGDEATTTTTDIENGEAVTIKGDTVITVTNKRKAKKIQIYKTDDSDTPVPLDGVGFTLGDNTLTTKAEPEEDKGYTGTVILIESDTPYVLTETTPKAHYTGLASTVNVTVNASGVSVPAGTENVSVSGPDDDGVYTITVVNPREESTVTVIKNVVGLDADKDAQYAFTATGLTQGSFSLYGQEKKEGDEVTQANSITFTAKYGDKFTITETTKDAFTTTNTVVMADTTTTNEGVSTGEVTVSGNVTVTYTNTRSKQAMQLLKLDESEGKLAGATFSLYTPEEYAKGESGVPTLSNLTSNAQGIVAIDEPVAVGTYYLVETKAPDGYILMSDYVTVVVESSAVTATIGSDTKNLAELITPEAGGDQFWQITVHNNSGQSLPVTGGIGTTPFTIIGTTIVILAVCVFGFGLRRGRERRMRA